MVSVPRRRVVVGATGVINRLKYNYKGRMYPKVRPSFQPHSSPPHASSDTWEIKDRRTGEDRRGQESRAEEKRELEVLRIRGEDQLYVNR